MVKSQEWLDREYPKEERKQIKELDISNKNLEGELDLSDFISLENLRCGDNQLTALNITGLEKLEGEVCCHNNLLNKLDLGKNDRITSVCCYENQLTNLNVNECKNLTKLSCYNNQLTELEISQCSKLKTFSCTSNKLTNLKLSSLTQLEFFTCNNNYMSSLDLFSLSPKTLVVLNVSNNNFPQQDLSLFSHLVNLEYLWIGNDNEDKIKQGICNRFIGSLEPLKDLDRLVSLYISNTDISGSIDYLPKILEEIYCSHEKSKGKIREIAEQLKTSKFFDFKEKENDSDSRYTRNWKDIDEEFDETEKKKWENRYFTYGQTKEWISAGLQNNDYNFASYLRWKGYNPKQNLNWEEMKSGFTNWFLLGNKNAQDYLDCFYPKGERENIEKLDLRGKDLEGDLDLEDFVSLKELFISGNPRLGELKNKNFSANKEVEYANPQEWLDKNYPCKEEVKEIILDVEELAKCEKGELVISDFPNLEKIGRKGLRKVYEVEKITISNCPKLEEVNSISYLYIQKLILTDTPNLKGLVCRGNSLTELDLSQCQGLINLHCWNNDIGNLDLSNNPNLEVIDCHENQLTKLNVKNCPKLKILDCGSNKLENLDLISLGQLERLNCSDNYLTSLDYSSLNPEKISSLVIENNDLKEKNLTEFSRFINLQNLRIGNKDREKIKQGICNRFIGSLEPLRNLTKLEILTIENTDIENGLEYLPESLVSFFCNNLERPESQSRKLDEELFLYGWNLKNWKEAHPELMGKNKINNDFENEISGSLLYVPPGFLNIKEGKIEENYNLKGVSSQEFALRDNRPFSWEISQKKQLLSEDLPLRFYNIKTAKIEENKESTDTKNYAVLSYVWGDTNDPENKLREEEEKELKKVWEVSNLGYRNELNRSGYKSWKKAIGTCKKIDINYLWMDQLCIDQNNIEEKNQEVPKMGKYYSNADTVLISINTSAALNESRKEFAMKTLKKIINSQWFARSWTYQEGILSRQTIFVFDNCLVDGRIMSQIWMLLQFEGEYWGRKKLNSLPEVSATPLGLPYYKNNYNSEEKKALLRLSFALSSVRNRIRSNPVDGFYSILGLLSYGEEVKVNYKPRMCPECPENREVKGCSHEEKNKQWPIYTKEELEQVLMGIMKLSLEYGYAESLSWYGSRRNKPWLWWIPGIDEKTGSTSVRGALSINQESEDVDWTGNGSGSGVGLVGCQCVIDSLKNEGDTYPVDGNLSNIEIGSGGSDFFLQGFTKSLERIKEGDIMVIPSEKQFKLSEGTGAEIGGKKTKVFLAILVPGENNHNCPIDTSLLVVRELDKWIKYKNEKKEERLFVDMVNKKVIEGEENIAQYQSQIQIPPKI
jgi:Leucine-rich repeat (LRR) protein